MTTEDERREAKTDRVIEDTTGFGADALRLTLDLVRRPGAVLRAYVEQGPSGGGRYMPALRYLFALNGIAMLLNAFLGGMGETLERLISADQLAALAEEAGKTPERLIADYDRWSSLIVVPIIVAAQTIAVWPLLRGWSGPHAKTSLRQTFALLGMSTLYGLPLYLVLFINDGIVAALAYGFIALGLIAFWRMGPGIWFSTPAGAVLKGVLLLAALFVGSLVGSILVLGPSLLAALAPI